MFLGRSIYSGLLQRSSNVKSVAAKEIAIWSQGGLAAEIDRTLHSEEFSIMVLPGLISDASSNWCGRNIFFLHVPKTAGTAFRIALTQAAGVPAVMSYRRKGTSRPHELKALGFWPLFAGHAHVDAFPQSHRGVTTFREPRSRLLSQYRMQQRDPRSSPHAQMMHDRDDRIKRWKANLNIPFEKWLRDRGFTQSHYFKSGVEMGRHWDNTMAGLPGRLERKTIDLSEAELRDSLAKGLARFDACAWAHDRLGLENALKTITGRDDVRMGSANEFQENRHAKPVIITSETMQLLTELESADQMLFNLASEILGLPVLSRSDSDRIFETTAKRLGFFFE